MSRVTFASSDYVTIAPLPWELIFEDLRAENITPVQVAELLDKSWSTVQRYLNGTEPKESVANAILELHSRYCGIEKTIERKSQARTHLIQHISHFSF